MALTNGLLGLRPLLVAACLCSSLAVSAAERVRGTGYAAVSAGDEHAAKRAARGYAFEEAALQGGATVRSTSVLDETGLLRESLLVQAARRIVSYTVVDEEVAEGTARTTIEAEIDELDPQACPGADVGGRVTVSLGLGLRGIPQDAAAIRATKTYEATLAARLLAGLSAPDGPAGHEFTTAPTTGYLALTRAAPAPGTAERGRLRLSATLAVVAPAAPGDAPRRLHATLDGDFEDGLAFSTRPLPRLEAMAVIDPDGTVAEDELPQSLASAVRALLCPAPAFALRAKGTALHLAGGSRHGLAVGAVLAGALPAGDQAYYRITEVTPMQSTVEPLHELPTAAHATHLTLLSTAR